MANRMALIAGAVAATSLLAGAVLPAWAGEDYPTRERVEYVLGCMRDREGPQQELLYKCSCVIDKIAEQMSYEEFTKDATTSNALSIGGERGEVMRAYVDGRRLARELRAVEKEARKACFLD
ncbi:MAG: hypothetical protein KDH15_14715 [Rhodocyclaceae bacterium]|nr:hypothetical protein [Rhodocyclaceae bacterium]